MSASTEKRRQLALAAAVLRVKVDREPVAITALDQLAAAAGRPRHVNITP
jgi:hypothetical protein